MSVAVTVAGGLSCVCLQFPRKAKDHFVAVGSLLCRVQACWHAAFNLELVVLKMIFADLCSDSCRTQIEAEYYLQETHKKI